MIRIRPYVLADKNACLAVFDSNVPDFFDATERRDFEDFLDSPDGEYFSVERNDAVIGCGGFARETRGQARFTWGMIDRAYHGAGLGRRLAIYRLQAIEQAAEFSEVELFTSQMVAPFFAKLGFVVDGIEKDGFAPGMDKVQMIKTLLLPHIAARQKSTFS